MNIKRIILWFVFAFSALMLWENYTHYTTRQNPVAENALVGPQLQENTAPDHVIKTVPQVDESELNKRIVNLSAHLIEIKNKRYELTFDPTGARLVSAKILSKTSSGKDNSFSLLDHRKDRTYLVQSGLIGQNAPNHETPFTLVSEPRTEGGTTRVVFEAVQNNIRLQRTYTLTDSYLIEVEDAITNLSNATVEPSIYYQILRRDVEDELAKQSTGFAKTFTGFAFYNTEDKYEAQAFSSLKKDAVHKNVSDGWIAGVEHYFLTAWLPSGNHARRVSAQNISGSDVFVITTQQSLAALEPGQTHIQKAGLWVGPQDQSALKKVDPTLTFSVDYGWMTFLAKPLFSLMIWIQSWVGNWGWTIVLLTLLIKVLLYPLVAKSQRSMAKMKLVSPRIQLLKEQFGDDKAKLNAAVMQMYKSEKINPMGGCLPIFLTIPVFLTLYRVILYSVELRGAPWLAWIADLSVSDPLYILPAIMLLTMFVQFKLNPTPPDKTQARMMMIMPLVFGVMMIWFPSGMVLYWTTNNILSILQQWHINRKLEQEKNEQILSHR